MNLARFSSIVALGMGALLAALPCLALDAADLARLKPGAVLSVRDPVSAERTREISITHVNPIREGAGVWYEIDGTSSNGQKEEILYVDFSTPVPGVEIVVRELNLKKLVDHPRKFLEATDKSAKGELVLNGVVFKYNDSESEDAFFEPDGDKTQGFEFSYLVFESTKDPGLSIQVMQWDDDDFETFLVRELSSGDVALK